MAQPNIHGRFIWQELLTNDPQAAQRFYPQIIDWKAQPWQDGTYVLLAAPTGPVAGLMQLPDEMRDSGAKPHWRPYIGTTDVDATVVAAQRLGARILHPPTHYEGVGRIAVMADPQGALFGLYVPVAPAAGPQGAAKPGEYGWFELATRDTEAAFRFYSALFGWQVQERMNMGAMGTYLIYGLDGVPMGGMFTPDHAAYWLSYVRVADADAAATATVAAGGTVLHGPVDVPGGDRIAQLLDPQGAAFAVFARGQATSGGVAVAKKTATRKPAATKRAATKPAAKMPATKKAVVKKAVKKKPVAAKKRKSTAKRRKARPPRGKTTPARRKMPRKASTRAASVRKPVSRRVKVKTRGGKAKAKVTARRGRAVRARPARARPARGK